MKYIIGLLSLLLILAACQPATEDTTPPADIPSTPDIPLDADTTEPPQESQTLGNDTQLSDVISEFNELDDELNYSWREESIPTNPIDPAHIQPWAARMLFLRDRFADQPESRAAKLVDARIAMLESQAAFYMWAKTQEGHVKLAQQAGSIVAAEDIECTRVPKIIEATNYLLKSHLMYQEFFKNMDDVLQGSPQAQAFIGVNEQRPAFYTSMLRSIPKQAEAIEDAFIADCEGKSVAPQSGEASS